MLSNIPGDDNGIDTGCQCTRSDLGAIRVKVIHIEVAMGINQSGQGSAHGALSISERYRVSRLASMLAGFAEPDIRIALLHQLQVHTTGREIGQVTTTVKRQLVVSLLLEFVELLVVVA